MTPNRRIVRQLTTTLEVFAEHHPGTVDEFVIVLEDQMFASDAIVPYWIVPPRNEAEGYRYGEDAIRLVRALRKNKKRIRKGTIISIPDAPGTEFDAAVFLPRRYVLLINAKEKTFGELSAMPNWPVVEEELRILVQSLDTTIRDM